MGGTLRAVDPATFSRLRRRVQEVLNGTAATYRCTVTDLEVSEHPYPPTVNDPKLVQLVSDLVGETRPPDDGMADGAAPRFEVLSAPSMAAEDFSYYGAQVPTVFTFMGIGNATLGSDVSLHNPNFRMDESQLPLGAALHAAFALRYLETHGLDGSGLSEQQQTSSTAGSSSAVAGSGGGSSLREEL